jgi:patatin-like phospholipase/acyl hydrolase
MILKMNPDTTRIISLDGGGTRGYLQICMLKHYSQQAYDQHKISEQVFFNSFDVIAGTSIGGIIALGLAFGIKLCDIENIFIEKAKRIFTTRNYVDVVTNSLNASNDNRRPNILQKLFMIANNLPFYKSKHCESNYGSNILHQTLFDIFGNSTLQDLKTSVLIPAYQQNTNTGVIFSNYNSDLYIGQNAKIVDVALATSAAPFYLPTYSFDKNTYIDGGVFCNDPTVLAYGLAKTLKKTSQKTCILSLGTGISADINS